ncbi:MAG: superoxide dismutase family protein [Bacteroidota bacterium]
MRRSAFLTFTLISGTIVLFVSPLWTQSPQGSGEARANAVIRGFTDPAIEGSVSFDQKDDMSVRITGEIRGLTAGQTYAIHVHEWGDCGEPNASGGHFDPFGSEHHGNPDGPIGTHHSGDLPNIQADQKGVAQLSFSTKGLTVLPSPYSVLGHAVVLHEHADDYSSQPAGNAGSRVACGVIGLVRD